MSDAPTYSTRLWSEEVARANADNQNALKPKPAYQFTGRTFDEPDTPSYARPE